MRTLVVFEDAGWRAFEMLAALRGVFDLRCGGRTLLERLHDPGRDDRLCLLGRAGLHDLWRAQHPGALIGSGALDTGHEMRFVNGRWLALGGDLERVFASVPGDFVLEDGGSIVAARCTGDAARRLAVQIEAACAGTPPARNGDAPAPDLARRRRAPGDDLWRDGSKLLAHAWDLVRENGTAIIDDFRRGPGAGIEDGALLYPGVHLLQDSAIRIATGCRLKPGVVLDAEDGPITLEAGVVVQPNVTIRGPVHIGPRSLLKAGAKLHEGTSSGPACKLGGEIEETVVQGFSNKQHEGFLGHAVLGEWVNLGADTNNSDLKNNYSTVRVWETGRSVDSGLLFVGLLCGDHVKTAIDTTFNTGTVVGPASVLFGAGFPPKFVAPFSWGGAAGFALYDVERALETARVVMQRRSVTLDASYARVFRAVFEAWRDRPRSGGES